MTGNWGEEGKRRFSLLIGRQGCTRTHTRTDQSSAACRSSTTRLRPSCPSARPVVPVLRQCPTSRCKSGLGDGLKLLVVNANAVPRVHRPSTLYERRAGSTKRLWVLMGGRLFSWRRLGLALHEAFFPLRTAAAAAVGMVGGHVHFIGTSIRG